MPRSAGMTIMHNRQHIGWVAIIWMLIALFITSGALGAQPAAEIGLTILHTNDLHGMLFPYDYDALGKSEKSVGGVSRRAALIRKLKNESPKPVLVMDAGDVFVRGPIQRFEGKPEFDVMNAVPYDVMTIGNNEIKGDDYTGSPGPRGVEILRERLAQARFPVVCANLIDKSTGKTLVPPYTVIERGGVKVGIFGLTTLRATGYPQAKGLEITDPIAAAREAIAELEPQCDFIIALTHIGYPMDILLARAEPGIAAIIGGDSHTWVTQPIPFRLGVVEGPSWWVGGPIICQAGEWSKCLGRLDLALRKDDAGRWRVTRYAAKLIDVTPSHPSAPDIDRILAPYKP